MSECLQAFRLYVFGRPTFTALWQAYTPI